jgi:hypothetical protein
MLVSYIENSYQIKQFGNEEEPIVIIDNFSGQVQFLLSQAINAHYAPAGVGYPGIRAKADSFYLGIRRQLLSEIMVKVFGFKRGANCESCTFSIVTTPADELEPAQRMPHYDDTGDHVLAALHYLKGEETGGTSFYRHRRSGFETVTPERAELYKQALRDDDKEYGPPESGYMYGDTTRFEMIADVPAKPDRMVIYRGRTLHSGSITPSFKPTPDPAKGRVTINTFLVNET